VFQPEPDGLELFHQAYEIKQRQGFERFRPFIGTHARISHITPHFVRLLEEVYKTTSHIWRVGECVRMVDVTREVRRLAPGYLPDPAVAMMIYPNIHEPRHAWTKISLPKGIELCVDPTGSPDTTRFFNILPYFGLADTPYALGYPLDDARALYAQSEAIAQKMEGAWSQALTDLGY